MPDDSPQGPKKLYETQNDNPPASNPSTPQQESPPPPSQIGNPPPQQQPSQDQLFKQQEPQGSPMPQLNKMQQMPKLPREESPIKLIAAGVIVLVLIGILYFLFAGHSAPMTTTTTVQTNPNTYTLNSCTTISNPGTYLITGDIATGIQNGSCIMIVSSNVNLVGQGHQIIGNGPYLSTGPSSHGISLSGVSKVHIQDLTVSKFSYGVYLNASDNNIISNITVRNITVSGIYILGSFGNLVDNGKLSTVNGQGGAIHIQNGGNNTVSGSTLQYNAYYGIVFNSTGNKVINDTILGNPVDLICSASSGYISYNKFSNTTCYVNNYCNFATCSEINLQTNPASIVLTNNVATCGSVNYPGKYNLSSNINVENFINVQTQSANSIIPCITIDSPNVNINCNGHSIFNGLYGIYSNNQYNTSITNCRLNNNTYSIYLINSLKFGLHGDTLTNSSYGAYIMSSTSGNLTDITASKNKYGIYINGTTYSTLTRYNTENNSYGVFLDNSTSISLAQGTTNLNSKTDLYCTASTYNSTLSTISDSRCTISDCIWAYNECPVHSLPKTIKTFPVSQCTTFTVPGQYSMSTNLLSSGNCFVIATSNVSIECNNHTINGFGTGTAIIANNVSNAAAFNCRIGEFGLGISASKAKYFVAQNIKMQSVGSGLNLTNAKTAIISNISVSNYTGSGFTLVRTNNSILTQDSAYSGGLNAQSSGFYLINSFNNTITNNSALNNKGYGFEFSNSRSNFVKNNSATSNLGGDYICDPSSSGIYANSGNINIGYTRTLCHWLVAQVPSYSAGVCTLSTSPNLITLTNDLLYPYGGVCFTVSSSNSTNNAKNSIINCGGHTIYASNGGTFLKVLNTSSVTLENCVLIGFTTPIVATNKYRQSNLMINNVTIGSAGTAISISNELSPTISFTNISKTSTGIILSSVNQSVIKNDILNQTVNGIMINSGLGSTIQNNYVSATVNALTLTNVTGANLQNNNFQQGRLYCAGSSVSKNSGNADMGGNICTINNCQWITSPSCP